MSPDLAENPLPSYWLHKLPADRVAASSAKTFAVAIVGGGLSGWATAFHVAALSPATRVAVLDARGIAGGASGRNGGLVAPRLAGSFEQLAARVAAALGVEAAGPGARALVEEETLKLRRFGIDNAVALKHFCDAYVAEGGTPDPLFHAFEVGSITSLASEDEREQAIRDAESWAPYLDKNDLVPEFIESEKVAECTGIKESTHFKAGGIMYKHWRVHPANLTLAIAQKAISMGNVSFFPDCHVTAVHRRNSEDPSLPSSAAFTLETSLGLFTATSQIVYATNAWTSAILPSIQITPIRNQLVCTAPVPSNLKWKNGEFALMMNEGYEYASGRGDGRVVLGGMRYLSENMDVGCDRDDSLNSTVSEALRNYLPTHFEGFGRDSEFAIEHEWAGIMGWTEDKFPYVGPLEGIHDFVKGEFIIAGFCGHGMARCFLSGKSVAEMMLGLKPSGNFPSCFLPSSTRMPKNDPTNK